jgi:hypothetical protein
MRPFLVADDAPEAFVKRARAVLRQLEYDDIVSLRLCGDQLIVRFSRLGTSEIRYRLLLAGNGFTAQLASSRIAAFHLPFQGSFEEQFREVLDLAGATIGD